MLLQELAIASSAVASTRSRREKINLLAALFERLRGGEIPVAVAYLSGTLPQGRVGLGWSAVAAGRTAAPSVTSTLDLLDADAIFSSIAGTSGPGSAGRRAELVSGLFQRATSEEQEFLVRLLSGELRQGALEGMVTEAVAKAARLSAGDVRQAAMLCGSLGEVAHTALTDGAAGLSRYAIQLFRPVDPMLASPAADTAEALEWLGQAAFELKVDGARIQVHKAGDEVRVFSRGLRDVTAAVPEVVEQMRKAPAREMIADGEVIALRDNGRPQPFQETMRRFGRRRDVDALRAELPLTPLFFDCLYLDGRPVTLEPQQLRFSALREAAPDLMMPHRVLSDAQAADEFLREALAAGHEGLMAKAMDAPYAAGSRGRAWLKIKRAHTLDLVVLAAEWGSGRRRGWLSNLHLGARDPETGRFVMLGKTFKGLTDETLEWQTAAFLPRETHREGHTVFIRPELVVEIAFNDIQESPHYPGGFALRFARVKGYRPDKTIEQADTIETVRAIYEAARAAPAGGDSRLLGTF
jgi:DNA ligase-1